MSSSKVLTDLLVEATIFNNSNQEQNFIKILKIFESGLKKLNNTQRMQFKMQNDTSLRFIKTIVKSSNLPQLQSLHDKVFTKLLMFNSTKMQSTELFEEFIKGITLFQKDFSLSQPIYHRDASCGPRSLDKETYKNTRSCKLVHTQKELKRNRKLIMRCYMERLIYDRIFSDLSLHFPASGDQESHQDKGHRAMLDDVKSDFESCYPNTLVEIEIKYHPTNTKLPVLLKIIKKSKRYQVEHEVQTFVKIVNTQINPTTYSDVYLDDVICKKEVRGDKYYKTQKYNSPSDRWKKDKDSAERYEYLFNIF